MGDPLPRTDQSRMRSKPLPKGKRPIIEQDVEVYEPKDGVEDDLDEPLE